MAGVLALAAPLQAEAISQREHSTPAMRHPFDLGRHFTWPLAADHAFPPYEHICFMDNHGEFSKPLAAPNLLVACVCQWPAAWVLGPYEDFYQMDVHDFLSVYPHEIGSSTAHPDCTVTCYANRTNWASSVRDGTLKRACTEVAAFLEVSEIAKVEQPAGACEFVLGAPTFADNARNHGGYDKTWHWYGRGHFEAVQPTDVVNRGRLPARGSPLQRSLQRGHTHPQLGVAYAPMIREGIDRLRAGTSVRPRQHLMDGRKLHHNYVLFAAGFAPVIDKATLDSTARRPAIVMIPTAPTAACAF